MKTKTILLLVAILILGFVLRLYHLEKVVGFDWDQEQTALAAKSILIDHKPTLIGMETGHGGIFMGSGYYYLMTIPYFLAKMNPFGAALFLVMLSVLTNFLIFLVAEKYFSYKIGILSAFIYASSNYLIRFDQTVWSANLIMIFSLLALLSFWALSENKKWGIYLLAFTLGFSFHIHFTLLILLPISLIAIFLVKPKFKLKRMIVPLLIFLILLAPLVIFDLRHGFLNLHAFFTMIWASDGGGNLLIKLWQMTREAAGSLRSIFVEGPRPLFDAIILAIFAWMVFQEKILRLFIILPIIFFSLYPGPFSNYYYLISMPAFIILISKFLCDISYVILRHQPKSPPSGGIPLLAGNLMRSFAPFTLNAVNMLRMTGGIIILIFLIIFFFHNFHQVSLKEQQNSAFSLYSKKQAVKFIIDKSQKKPFQLAYTTEKSLGYGFAYLFYYYQAQITDNPKSPRYTLVVPSHFQKITPWYVFGDIGVIGPRYD